jgi:hypothetical protein
VGVEPTESQALDLLALPVCVLGRQSRVQELHLAGGSYGPPPGTAPPRSVGRICNPSGRFAKPSYCSVAGPGIEPGRRPYGSRPGTCQACSDQGESCTPTPLRAPPSEDGVSAHSTTWPFSSSCGNRTRPSGVRGRCPGPLDERAVSASGRSRTCTARRAAALQAAGLADDQPMHRSVPDGI